MMLPEVTAGLELMRNCWQDLVVPRKQLIHLCDEQGIMVRHYAKPELKNFIRISAGKPEQTDRLLQAIEALV